MQLYANLRITADGLIGRTFHRTWWQLRAGIASVTVATARSIATQNFAGITRGLPPARLASLQTLHETIRVRTGDRTFRRAGITFFVTTTMSASLIHVATCP